MDGKFFYEWLHKLNPKFEMQEGRNVVMIVNNCPEHPEASGLKAINLQFLRPNTTSCTQPRDQGLIRCACFTIFSFF